MPLVLPLVVLGTLAAAKPEAPESWVVVRSPRFTVFTDAGAQAGRRVAEELESMRLLLQERASGAWRDPIEPVVVYVLAGEAGMAELVPELWEDERGARPAGIYREGPDRHYIALRLDARGERSTSAAIHEYFHLLSGINLGRLPLWLGEGLAKYWETTEIERGRARVGVPSRRDLELVRDGPLIPLPILFAIDPDSPRSLDAEKATSVYAQSWALVHYLMTGDRRTELARFVERCRRGADFSEAAKEAFGDAGVLSRELDAYVDRGALPGFTLEAPSLEGTHFETRPASVTEILVAKADFLIRGEAPEKARPLLEEAMRLGRNEAAAYEGMAFLSLTRSELAEAREWLDKALELDSASGLAHYYSAAIHLQTGDYEPGLEAARRAVERMPESPRPRYLLGRLLAFEDHADEAFLAFMKALELRPRKPHLLAELGFALIELERFDEAATAFTRALELSPDDADLTHAVAIAELGAGNDEASVRAFRKAAALDPENAGVAFDLGVALEEMGELAGAERSLRRAVALAPDHAEYHYRLGRVLEAAGRDREAEEHFREARRLGHEP